MAKQEEAVAANREGPEAKVLMVTSDGAARGNPGPAGLGGVVSEKEGPILFRVCEYLGETTNNVAEYWALVRILEKCRGLGYRRLEVRTDSEIVVQQLTGRYKVKSKSLAQLFSEVKEMLAEYDDVIIKHIPREENREADKLANQAIDKGLEGRLEPVMREEPRGLF